MEKPAIHPDNLTGEMTTLSGIKFDLINPTSKMVKIEDIVTGLVHNSHFNGQSPRFFSIAQHSVMVLEDFIQHYPDADTDMKLLALLHDASEAYTGDIIKPLKVLLGDVFGKIEKNIMRAIACRFEIPLSLMVIVKESDLRIQNIEHEAFYNNGAIDYWSHKEAYHRFMAHFNNLMDQRITEPGNKSISLAQ